MGIRLIFLNYYGWFLQEGRRRVADPGCWIAWFKPVGGFARRPCATNGESQLREVMRRALALMNSVIPCFREKLR